MNFFHLLRKQMSLEAQKKSELLTKQLMGDTTMYIYECTTCRSVVDSLDATLQDAQHKLDCPGSLDLLVHFDETENENSRDGT